MFLWLCYSLSNFCSFCKYFFVALLQFVTRLSSAEETIFIYMCDPQGMSIIDPTLDYHEAKGFHGIFTIHVVFFYQ